MRIKNKIAHDLRTPKYRQRVVNKRRPSRDNHYNNWADFDEGE